ncbi:M48 family metallopeptidase [Weeksellaceae bacterium KMM 9724]|uniref:M48 family metallopeptidase n=1 Tax=Profundicola chukchiensis TaxID=2961959 RepID=UPI00243B98DD|nr:M48 family metallopeptidase [Profundicola chukchiensis]MDG4950832.1 M48 family metallopeptidase [Profundicola chukchiensis]
MRSSSGFKLRLIIGLLIAAFALFNFFSSTSVNEITGKKQHINISLEQEIKLGLDGRDYMIQESGGLYQDAEVQQYIDLLGRKIVENSEASKTSYQYEFHVLADPNQVNAFAMPGGQIFITYGLYKRLESEDQVAGVLGHEIGHVAGRHSAEQMAKQDLTQGLAGAAGVVGGDMSSAQYAQMIGNMVNMKYGREDELEADELGVHFMVQSGYDPHALIRVMEILDEASGGQAPPEFQSTHPSPENRVQRIKEAIEKYGGSATPNTNSNKLPSKVPSNTSGDY